MEAKQSTPHARLTACFYFFHPHITSLSIVEQGCELDTKQTLPFASTCSSISCRSSTPQTEAETHTSLQQPVGLIAAFKLLHTHTYMLGILYNLTQIPACPLFSANLSLVLAGMLASTHSSSCSAYVHLY
jgi:hypothetical protein